MPTIYRVVYVPTPIAKLKQGGMYSIRRRLADRWFTKYIKAIRNNTCEKCHTKHAANSKGLHVSHYFSRAREATRFDNRNVDLLCTACHKFFTYHRGEYTKWKCRRLGKGIYLDLFQHAKKPNVLANIADSDKLTVSLLKSELDGISS